MTDYRFVSAPNVVLKGPSDFGTWMHEAHSGEGFVEEDVEFLFNHGIIEPVPMEIPAEIVEAAAAVIRDAMGLPGRTYINVTRAALIAAKEAGL